MQTFYSHIKKNNSLGFLFKFIFVVGMTVIGSIVAEVFAYIFQCVYEGETETTMSPAAETLSRILGYVIVFLIMFGSYAYQKSEIKKGIIYLFEKMGHIELQKIYDNLLLERKQMSFKLSNYQYDIFRQITPEQCKTLSNIIEEMAIAANVKRPEIFIDINNKYINACTLGIDKNQAGISVSYGALTKLTRDELQGVIAHEFSHICNGDTETNMRAIAAISGMTIIADIGYLIMQAAARSDKRRSSSSSKDKDGSGAIMVGLIIFVSGSLGVVFGEIMKMAISRKNEYIADATAVKYTRNPAGLLGALLKIAAETHSIKLGSSPYSHMYFAPAFTELLASHPPIKKRIKAIESIAGKGETQELAKKIYTKLKDEQTYKLKIVETVPHNSIMNSDICELNRAIVAAAAIAQAYDMNMRVSNNEEEHGIDCANFTNLAQSVSVLVRITAKKKETLDKLAATSPSAIRKELSRGLCDTKDSNTIFNVVNKCRAFYKLSAELLQTQARTLLNNFADTEMYNMSALALGFIFSSESVSDNKKFDEPVFNAMVPRLFGFLLRNTLFISGEKFTSIYTESLKKCGVPYTDYLPFPLEKLRLVLESICDMDTKHFRIVTDALDSMLDKSLQTVDFITIRSLLEAHCEAHNGTEFALDASEAVIVQEEVRKVTDILEQTGYGDSPEQKNIKALKQTYDIYLKLLAQLVEDPENLRSLSNLIDFSKIDTIILKIKRDDPSIKLSDKEFDALLFKFNQAFHNAPVSCKRGMYIGYQRLFQSEAFNCKLAYFSLVINLSQKLNTSNEMSEAAFAEHCNHIYLYLATNSTPTESHSRQDFVNEACTRTGISPIQWQHTRIREIITSLLELRNLTTKQKERFKAGFDYMIRADDVITDDERFLNSIFEMVVCNF